MLSTNACFFSLHKPSNVLEYNAWVVWTTFMILLWQFCSLFGFWQPVITLYFHCIEKSSMNFKTSHFVLHGRKKTYRFKQSFFCVEFPLKPCLLKRITLDMSWLARCVKPLLSLVSLVSWSLVSLGNVDVMQGSPDINSVPLSAPRADIC